MKTKATVYSILAGYSNIIFSIFSGLVLVPFYLKDFGAEVYGVWLATGNLVSWLGIMGGALSVVFAQKVAVAYSKSAYLDFRELVGSGLILFSILACFISFGAFLTSDVFLSFFSFDVTKHGVIKMALIFSSLAAAITVYHSLFVYILGAWLINGPVLQASLIGGATGIILNIALLYYGFGLLSIPLAMFGKAIVMICLLFRSVFVGWKNLKLSPPVINLKRVRILAVESSPILISNIASIGLNHSQSTIIGILFGPTAATIIAVTDKLYSLVKAFVYPVGNALLQPLSSIFHLPDKFDVVTKKFLSHMNFLSLFCILVCFAINKIFISIWLGQNYYGGILVSVALAFSALLIIRVNIIIAILNARGLFKITSVYAIFDLTVRIASLLLLFFVFNLKNIALLPIAECIGIIIATKFILLKNQNLKSRYRNIDYLYFIVLLFCGILGVEFQSYVWYFKLAGDVITSGFLIYIIYEVYKERIIYQIISKLKVLIS